MWRYHLWYLAIIGTFGAIVAGLMMIEAVTWRIIWTTIAPTSSSDLAAWVQAVGSVIAIAIAIYVPAIQIRGELRRRREDKENALAEERLLRKEHVRRLIAGLKVEVKQALETVERLQLAGSDALSGTRDAVARGRRILDQQIPREATTISDEVIYRAVAAEIGGLPPAIVQQLVSFYANAKGVERTAMLATSGSGTFSVFTELGPRLQLSARGVISVLQNFEDSDFSDDASLSLNRREMETIARQSGYSEERIVELLGPDRPSDPIVSDRGSAGA